MGNLLDVKTKTSQDWAKYVDTETPSRLSLISVLVDMCMVRATYRALLYGSMVDINKGRRYLLGDLFLNESETNGGEWH